MSQPDDEGDELERIAIEQSDGPGEDTHLEGVTGEDGLERCPHCHRPVDDIESMDEPALLDLLRIGALRSLARSMQNGQMTHQELAILRGMIKDNTSALKPLEKPEAEKDPNLPDQGHTTLPTRRARPDYEGTEG